LSDSDRVLTSLSTLLPYAGEDTTVELKATPSDDEGFALRVATVPGENVKGMVY